MTRMILSQEQLEREAQILADYKNKKMMDLEKFIETMDKTFDKEIDALFRRMQDKMAAKVKQVFSTQEQKKLMKDIGLIEPSTTNKTKPKRRKKNQIEGFKEELIKTLNKQLKELELEELDEILDEVVKEAPKKKKRGRPKGSKNKKRPTSHLEQPIKFIASGDW